MEFSNNNILLVLFLIILSFIFLIWIYLGFFWKNKSKKKLSIDIEKYKNHIKNINRWDKSFKEQILDYDKIYHNILKEAWYNWSFWEILKQKPSIISDIDNIWKLHKLRNKLTHDMDDFEKVFLQKKSKEYKKEVEKLLSKLSC